ncbi:MAG: hypothetical protein IKO55_15545, partial [Kiritimatiellae bacterium]|nr:hypothetical protein [Kiritimatiellia bacterium]
VGSGPNKLLSVRIPGTCSSGVILVRYRMTFLQRFSQFVSLVSALGFLVLFIIKWRRRRLIARGG